MTSLVVSLRRRSIVIMPAVLVVAALSAGCSEEGSAEQNSPVSITTKNANVLIENRSGQPLNDVTLSVVPFGKGAFSKSLSRLDTAERREVPLTQLASQDGTMFIPMLNRPKLLRVTATDPTGRQYDIEQPWR